MSAIAAGRLRDLILFEKRVVTISDGTPVISWTEDKDLGAFNLWATVLRLGERRARFTIRYRGDINATTHRIIWDNKYWEIKEQTADERRTAAYFECEGFDVEVTHLQSTEREFIQGDAYAHLNKP